MLFFLYKHIFYFISYLILFLFAFLIYIVDAATSKDNNEEKEEPEKNESERLSIFVDTQKTQVKKQEDESVKIRDNKLYYQKIGLLYPKIGKDEIAQVNSYFRFN